VARKYLDYWQRLADNLTPSKLCRPNKAATPTPRGKPPKNSVSPLFSARDDEESNETLQWYADRLAEAKQVACMTFAFNIDTVFQQVLSADNDVLRYIVKDDPLGEEESIGHDRDVIFAAGGYLGEGALANFLTERSNPLNRNRYIHNKFMLVDPLSEDPLVITGSANFSRPSQRTNDENMLIVRGNTRVADIYFGEFMRVFDHHYARYLVRVLTHSTHLLIRSGAPPGVPHNWKQDTDHWPIHLVGCISTTSIPTMLGADARGAAWLAGKADTGTMCGTVKRRFVSSGKMLPRRRRPSESANCKRLRQARLRPSNSTRTWRLASHGWNQSFGAVSTGKPPSI
jgi:phosphatidylserine/phosphatidylglycerophosphate/cardiolipin synthase-like enzyme